ncbi:hypothetical protein FJY84_07920, partial [Candidatus Bathyarchaeota archaeon]|nr:hypothetical protein [Candidatus Bathyarchaeota archaeon]
MKLRSGISTMIASILLIVMVVMAASLVYAYTMGYVGGFGGQKLLGAMVLDAVTIETDSPNMIVMVRNIGNAQIEVSDAYINGEKVNVTCSPNIVLEGKSGMVTITRTDNFSAGVTYSVKIVCKESVQLM